MARIDGWVDAELWSAATLRPIGEPVALPGRTVFGRSTNTDGSKLVQGTVDGSGDAVVWDLAPAHWESIACRIASRNLTGAEWSQYLPGHDYQRTCPERRGP